MASRIIFDPLVALRLSPLISSTCSLWFAWDQHLFLRVFVNPTNRSFSDQYLPTYFRTFFRGGLTWVLVLLGVTLATASLNIATDRASLRARQSLQWYAAGAAFSAGHAAFAPIVAPKVRAISEDHSKGKSTRDLEGWLRLNLARMFTVDAAAWVCFAVGAIRTLSEGECQ
ncbi:hypothetical protein EYZ11_008227 [Aspergillus tanneri]|uniref:Integral membrane protein n=1 Tax=Aspergillus tanneri TaxID=1220188 RepID=A0A4S3JD66_9EURO|nr:uncharacterized protein ATNIH1004_008171 [Aspergillus tanneri]KAA8643975.1 hypothetical protein ATNIH1004_008171 [Aspergillus tanneri]THC92307.1 hypothetical protein EYZ11_008227 [Aspergillus tanneri]